MMSKQPAVLVVGAGILQVFLIRQVKELGLAVVAVDGNPEAPGFKEADKHFTINTYNAEQVAGIVPVIQELYDLRGVVTGGADVAPTVSLAAEAAGLPCLPYDIAKKTHNKAVVREILRQNHLHEYQPNYEIMGTALNQCDYEMCIESLCGYPVVFKPLSQRASRGVSIIHGLENILPAVEKLKEYGPTFLIEQCLVGTERSAEMIFANEYSLAWFNIVDRVFSYDHGIPLEIGHINPTRLSEDDQEKIFVMMNDVADALDVTWGPFKCDIMMTDDGPKLLECTARLSGGFDSQCTSPLTGRHPMRTLIELACGMPITEPFSKKANGYAACAAVIPKRQGTLIQWPVSDHLCVQIIQPGGLIAPPQHLAERSGYVIEWADTYDEAWSYCHTMAEVIAEAMIIAEG